MKQRKPQPVAWILAVLGTLALLTPGPPVTLADGGVVVDTLGDHISS